MKVRIEGVHEARSLMERLQRMEGMRKGLRVAAHHLKGKMDDYPPRRSITRREAYGTTFFSERQRRAFFALLREGVVMAPYRRRGAGGLAGKWSIVERRGGLVQQIGNNASYARYVVDRDRQARMMRLIGWKTAQEVAEREWNTVLRIVKTYMLATD